MCWNPKHRSGGAGTTEMKPPKHRDETTETIKTSVVSFRYFGGFVHQHSGCDVIKWKPPILGLFINLPPTQLYSFFPETVPTLVLHMILTQTSLIWSPIDFYSHKRMTLNSSLLSFAAFNLFWWYCLHAPKFEARLFWSQPSCCGYLMYQPNRSLNIPPRAFDVFSCPGGREFDELSLPGGGEFDHYKHS